MDVFSCLDFALTIVNASFRRRPPDEMGHRRMFIRQASLRNGHSVGREDLEPVEPKDPEDGDDP